jgi:predicted SnoaL-like aldol condensation-catalyzing enzyme
MAQTLAEQNRHLALRAFDALFNRRDFDAAAAMWSEGYIQHSTQIAPGRNGLFERVRSFPATFRYENVLAVAEGDYVVLHGRFSGQGQPRPMIVVNILRIENGRLAEHWDVVQDEATAAESKSGLPMIGDRFLVLE